MNYQTILFSGLYAGNDCTDVYDGIAKCAFCWCGNSAVDDDGVQRYLSAAGLTLNTMVLFGLVMGLGMLVDDGIVVVDNVFANMKKGMDRYSGVENWYW